MKVISLSAKGLKRTIENVVTNFTKMYNKYSNLFFNSQSMPLLFDTYRKNAISAIRSRFPGTGTAHPIFRGFPTSDKYQSGDFTVEQDGRIKRYTMIFRHAAEVDGNVYAGKDKAIYHPFRKKAFGRGAYGEPINRLMLEIFDKGKKAYVIPSTGKKQGLITTLGRKAKARLRFTAADGTKVKYNWKRKGRIRVPSMKGAEWRYQAFQSVLKEVGRLKEKLKLSIAKRRA